MKVRVIYLSSAVHGSLLGCQHLQLGVQLQVPAQHFCLAGAHTSS
jgi:hypothetical protein